MGFWVCYEVNISVYGFLEARREHLTYWSYCYSWVWILRYGDWNSNSLTKLNMVLNTGMPLHLSEYIFFLFIKTFHSLLSSTPLTFSMKQDSLFFPLKGKINFIICKYSFTLLQTFSVLSYIQSHTFTQISKELLWVYFNFYCALKKVRNTSPMY